MRVRSRDTIWQRFVGKIFSSQAEDLAVKGFNSTVLETMNQFPVEYKMMRVTTTAKLLEERINRSNNSYIFA